MQWDNEKDERFKLYVYMELRTWRSMFQSLAGLPDKKAEVGQGSGKKPNNGEAIKWLHPYTQTNKWLKVV